MPRLSTLLAVVVLTLCSTLPLPLVAAQRYGVTPMPFLPFSNTGGEALSNTVLSRGNRQL